MSRRLLTFLIFSIFLPSQAFAVDIFPASDSPSAKSIVMIKTENAGIFGGKQKGVIDKATGRILLIRNVMPVKKSREGIGVILSPAGLIVTASHIVTKTGKVTVKLYDDSELLGKVVYIVPENDLAFIQVDTPEPLPSALLGDVSQIQFGSKVYLLSPPSEDAHTFITGQVKNMEPLKPLEKKGLNLGNLIHINFPAIKGVSGSPIFDAKGEVIGILVMGVTGLRKATFAMPADIIRTRYSEYLQSLCQTQDPKPTYCA